MLQHIATTADGIFTVIFIIGVFRHDTDDRDGIKERIIGFGKANFHGSIVQSHGTFDHGKVGFGTFGITDGVEGIYNITCGERITVGEFHVITDGKSPNFAAIGRTVFHRKVIDEIHIRVGGDQGTLDQRFVNVIPGTPAHNGVKSPLRLGTGAHGDNDIGAFAVVRGLILITAGRHREGNGKAKAQSQ